VYTPVNNKIKEQSKLKQQQQINNQNQFKPISNILDLSSVEICKYASTLARDQAGCRLLQKKIEEDNILADEIFSYVNYY
jgi:hypothetical protein